ncbi:DUF4417 domain-containing protein [bacterium]|nr:DUF4417 domain-containing protein [bacterium]
MPKHKIIIDDGFNPEFVEGAKFDGILEMPCIEKPSEIIIPKRVIPFSKISQSGDHSEFVTFYEYDIEFSDILKNPEKYYELIKTFAGIVTLDNSLYRDMPLQAQMSNTYRNRAVGYYYQKRGVYVIPNIRWGDERSYTTKILPEKFAFLGIPKHSIVSIGTYGGIRSREDKYFFKHGLKAMLEELLPEVVLVYGAMPDSIFADVINKTKFVHYPDWISCRKRRM